jgi:hypothetical protein
MVERFAVARGQPVEGNSGFIVGRLRAARAACDNFGLSYDSSSGNGPYGFGWSLSLPAVTRRTDKGLPRYQDAEESDIFILSGAEDLAPVLVQDGRGNWIEEPIPHRDCYAIKAYRPRTEGLFARIERWTRLEDGATHWRSISRDNILSVYAHCHESPGSGPLRWWTTRRLSANQVICTLALKQLPDPKDPNISAVSLAVVASSRLT